ncbi:MAG: phosphopantetheine-binding protein [Flavobacteriales bacterium]|nr:phosphopantetheine-binding protein [Flavobacteriales bacterium]MCX7650440.1 phosphopantetheine-binding protein [Flavobacteriales bacterium]MDW8432795.1 phosphopantetheine-binding protein [Flavobacteriales bacterium]
MEKNQLCEQLKNQIIQRLNLEGMTSADIADDQPLFAEGLGLDSIDALELIVLMEQEYGIKIENPQEGRAIFSTISSMADYILRHRAQ